MGNVIRMAARRERPSAQFAPGPLFERAWKLYPESGRRRSSRYLSAPEWAAAACVAGEEALLVAVRRYATEDRDYRKECGAPAFHRWLGTGRWENWIPEPLAKREFPVPEVRASFFLAFSSERARKWFDTCTLDGPTLIIESMPRQEWLVGPFSRWALANRINGWRLK